MGFQIWVQQAGYGRMFVSWEIPLYFTASHYMVELQDVTAQRRLEYGPIPSSNYMTYPFPDSMLPGHHYRIQMVAIGNNRYDQICSNMVSFKLVYGPEELEELAGMASAFILNHRRPFTYAHLLHRNKPSADWREIFDQRGGIMEVYLKDSNGDQASPINNNIDGLFFSATIEASTGLPPKFSPFGNQRLEMPVQELCNENTNLYFADFYCNSAIYKHYITLVLTPKGSDADFFCANTLVPLDPLHNDFFSLESHMEGDMKGCPEPQLSRKDEFSYRETLWDFAGGMQGCKGYTGFKCEEICCEDDWGLEKLWDEPTECVCVRVPRHANVEVLYTEDIDVGLALGRPGVSMYSVPSSGSSRPGGFPKNLDCPECSLSPYVHLFDLMVDFE